jgi:hypothetical protein
MSTSLQNVIPRESSLHKNLLKNVRIKFNYLIVLKIKYVIMYLFKIKLLLYTLFIIFRVYKFLQLF